VFVPKKSSADVLVGSVKLSDDVLKVVVVGAMVVVVVSSGSVAIVVSVSISPLLEADVDCGASVVLVQCSLVEMLFSSVVSVVIVVPDKSSLGTAMLVDV